MPDRPARPVRVSPWALPAFSIALGAIVGGLIWTVGDDAALGAAFLAIMTAYAVVLRLGGASETVRMLRGEVTDERRELITLRATAVSYHAVVTVAVIGLVFEMIRGELGGFTVVAAVGGASFVLATAVLRRRL